MHATRIFFYDRVLIFDSHFIFKSNQQFDAMPSSNLKYEHQKGQIKFKSVVYSSTSTYFMGSTLKYTYRFQISLFRSCSVIVDPLGLFCWNTKWFI